MELRPSKTSRSSLNKYPSSLHGTWKLLAYCVHSSALFHSLLPSGGENRINKCFMEETLSGGVLHSTVSL